MGDILKGWRTVIVFSATLVLAVARAFGWEALEPGHETAIAEIVGFLLNPIVLSIIALILRKLSTTPVGDPDA